MNAVCAEIGWCRITVDGEVGYCLESYLVDVSDYGTETEAEE